MLTAAIPKAGSGPGHFPRHHANQRRSSNHLGEQIDIPPTTATTGADESELTQDVNSYGPMGYLGAFG